MGGQSETQLEPLVHSVSLGDTCPLDKTLSQTCLHHASLGQKIHLGSPGS